MTTTRLVAEFSDFEARLANAIERRDEAALGRLLSDEFEQWTPAPPGDPIAREDWLHTVLTSFRLDSFQIRQMAVRPLEKWALVSFVLSRKAVCDGRDCSGDLFIVDLWEQHAGAPLLLERYESPVSGLLPKPPKSPPRPTGKE